MEMIWHQANRMSNRDIERYYFDMFRRDYHLPQGTMVHGDKPDMILKGERKIGIEITNFFLENGALPESQQVQRKARETVVSKAQQIYLGNGGKGIEVSFSFDKASPIRDQKKLAKKMAELAKDIDRRKTGEISKDAFKNMPELSFVFQNVKEYEDPKWKVVQRYPGQVMSMEKLRRIVSTKEAQSKFYQPCDAYWLVVVVDSIDRAQDQEIQIDGFEKVSSPIFERVIVYKTHFRHVLEVK
jgi:hypothetical protein